MGTSGTDGECGSKEMLDEKRRPCFGDLFGYVVIAVDKVSLTSMTAFC
jgi:hypothetical protein